MTSPKNRNWSVSPNTTTKIVGGLFRSRNYIWENDQKVAAHFGISWSQFLVMRALRFGSETFTLSPTELYEAAQASSSGMTKMLHGLTEAKLVVRIDNPNDARSTLVRLTSKGADMVETIVDELIKVNTALLDGVLSPSESEQLATLLNTLSQRLQEKKQAQKLEK